MGLLDEAIRDHLDLKRRRGADPAEIERAEREALGPVRRDPIASDQGDDSAGPSAVVEPSPSPADTDVMSDRHVEVGPAGETFGGELGDDEQSADEDWDDYEDDDYEDDHEFEPGHSDPGPDSSARSLGPPEAHREQPVTPHPDEDLEATRAFKVEQGSESEGTGEDVLEETPEFLQDTPDHDRLWFEQRPPKDFDFDE
jgi:hypothetical protein